jgi:hypothetical protein
MGEGGMSIQVENSNGASVARGEAGLCFARRGGPIVAVVGLHGGAGVSTLAYALAHRAAVESPAGVLLVETAGSRRDQASLAGVFPLHALDEPPDATTGKPATATAAAIGREHLTQCLNKATIGRGLTVVDAGNIRSEGVPEVLPTATHVVYVSCARPGAAARARQELCWVSALGARQALLVRADGRHARRSGEWRSVAAACCDQLIFASDGVSGRQELATLTALAGFLQRGPT